jgi:hypothetical protein
VDEMYLDEIWELFDYWREFPPTHIILSAMHGGERKNKPSAPREKVPDPEQNAPAKSFDSLPLAVQQAIEKERAKHAGRP